MGKTCRYIVYGFILLLSVTVLSCKKQKTTEKEAFSGEPSQAAPISIGFSIDTLAIERWIRDCDVFLNTAKELGADVIVQNSGNSVEEQNRQIQYLINRNVDVIVIVAKKDDSLTESVQKARSHGIPVISYDRLIRNADISLYLTVDTEKVGEYMAKELYKVKPYGNWFCILGPQEDYNTTFIQTGVNKVLTNTPVKITLTSYTADWNYDLSYQKMHEELEKGNIPDAVICGNDALADSVVQAISEICPGRNIPVCGQDADIAACQNIVEGKQVLTVYKPITELAERAAHIAYQLASGKTVREVVPDGKTMNNGYADIPVILLDPVPVTIKNIDKIVIDSGFHTYGEVYKNRVAP